MIQTIRNAWSVPELRKKIKADFSKLVADMPT